MTLLQTRGISVVRPQSAPLFFPDLAIMPQDKILILGPSGCGKTTLLSIIAGLLKPTTGDVRFGNDDFYALPARQRDLLRGKCFGFVFQTLHLLPSITLRQNISLAGDMAGVAADPARLNDLLNRLGLNGKAHRRPEALSQGEQQRAAIARAVLNRPKIIVADEPTSALDDENAKAVLDLLMAQAAESGAALVVATHDNRIVPAFSTVIRLQSPQKEVA